MLAFDSAGGPWERFDGIVYDIEPYLLSGWLGNPDHGGSIAERARR